MERDTAVGEEVPVLLARGRVGEPGPFSVPREPHDAALRTAVGPQRGQVREERMHEKIPVAGGEFGGH